MTFAIRLIFTVQAALKSTFFNPVDVALFGDLQRHALANLAEVMHTLTSTLVLRSSDQDQTLELVLKTGQLRAIHVDSVPIETIPEVRDILKRLHAYCAP